MCFSAAGSLTLSGALAGIGATGFARNSDRRYRLFAAIPLIFAAQQAAEGIVWLTFPPDSQGLHTFATVAFLGLALVVWPVWVPLSLRAAEPQPERRRTLTGLVGVGGFIAIVATILLVRSPPVAVIAGHSIRYNWTPIANHAVRVALLLMYVLPTIGPFFVSTARMSRTIGVTLLVSLGLTLLIEWDAVTSVWCFFAAILSLQTLVALKGEAPDASPRYTV